MIRWGSLNYENSIFCTRLFFSWTGETCFVNICMHVVLHAWAALGRGGGGGVSRDFSLPVQGSALSRLASMPKECVFR